MAPKVLSRFGLLLLFHSLAVGMEIDIVHIKVGCDKVVNSGRTIDKCGVCGGDGRSCEVVEGLFRLETLPLGYNYVVRIPAGATRINITELSKSLNYIAVNSTHPGGRSSINGVWGQLDPPKRYAMFGTYVTYKRPLQTNEGESMIIPGPTSEDIKVWLFFQRDNPGIFYEYTLPKSRTDELDGMPSTTNNRNILRQVVNSKVRPRLDIGRTETIDGHGYVNHRKPFTRPGTPIRPVYRPITVPESFGIHRTQPPLDADLRTTKISRPNREQPNTKSKVQFAPKPQERKPYSPENAPKQAVETVVQFRPIEGNIETVSNAQWVSEGFSKCSKSCAGGRQTALIKCVSRDTRKTIDDRYCNDLPRPNVIVRKCNLAACPPYYYVTPWSECSRTCGVGRRSRRVYCRQQFVGNFTTNVNHRRCRKLKRPRPHETCQAEECARWIVSSDWSECSAQCGTGRKSRDVICSTGDGARLPNNRCLGSRPPPTIKSCKISPCITAWFSADWGECSADCDTGVQNREVQCINTAGLALGCATQSKPEHERSCTRSSCGHKYEWFTGPWGPCSTDCGEGTQVRRMTCMVLTPDGGMEIADSRDLCSADDQPPTSQSCNTQACGSRWFYTDFNECSASCGGGARSRNVWCLDADGKQSSTCKATEKPSQTERCNIQECAVSLDPQCRDLLGSCRMVLQARLCSYAYYKRSCCRTCSQDQPAALLSKAR